MSLHPLRDDRGHRMARRDAQKICRRRRALRIVAQAVIMTARVKMAGAPQVLLTSEFPFIGTTRLETWYARLALYLGVAVFGLSQARAARACGVSRQYAGLTMHVLEDLRDDPALDAFLEAAA